MPIKKIRLDEDSLASVIAASLKDAGFVPEGSSVRALELKTRTLKKGGDYYTDLVEPGYAGEIELVKWVRVLVETPDPKEDLDDEA